jgi:ABC-2 type transport system permease protein
VNPVSYMIEGLRSLVITGWDAQALALGFGCTFGLIALSLVLATRQLKVRMTRT